MDKANEQGYHGMQKTSKGFNFFTESALYHNGRRKGYIDIMKELWDEKGYGHLELKSQNL